MMSRSVMQEQVKQHRTAQVGYTDHKPGLYSDRFTHKNIQTENGRYNWIGDQYKDPGRELPGRWKKKQFMNSTPEWYPGSKAEFGGMGLNGERIPANREGDVFASVHAPVRKDDHRTKVGFGATVGKSKFVPDMSTSMRQARYTHALKKEQRTLKTSQQPEVAAPFEAWGDVPKPDQYDELDENDDPFIAYVPAHLRDKHPLTTRQQRQKQSRKPRVYGSQPPTSTQIGENVWGAQPESTDHFKCNATKYFVDKTHLN
jgi:hypothetical protein